MLSTFLAFYYKVVSVGHRVVINYAVFTCPPKPKGYGDLSNHNRIDKNSHVMELKKLNISKKYNIIKKTLHKH